MRVLLGDIASLRYALGALLGLASIGVTIYWIASWFWLQWKKKQIKRSWAYFEQTGDPSKLDPEGRALLEAARQARPGFGQSFGHKPPAQETDSPPAQQ